MANVGIRQSLAEGQLDGTHARAMANAKEEGATAVADLPGVIFAYRPASYGEGWLGCKVYSELQGWRTDNPWILCERALTEAKAA